MCPTLRTKLQYSYTIFGLASSCFAKICLICAKKHWYLEGKWWIDSQGNKKYYLICDNIKEPGIPVDEALGVYSENTVLNQPIPWSYALRFPDKRGVKNYICRNRSCVIDHLKCAVRYRENSCRRIGAV